MAEIHVLPHDRDAVRLARAYDMLKHRFDAGEELGTRIHHIRSLTSSLEASLRDFCRLVDGFGDEASPRLSSGPGGTSASAEAAAVRPTE